MPFPERTVAPDDQLNHAIAPSPPDQDRAGTDTTAVGRVLTTDDRLLAALPEARHNVDAAKAAVMEQTDL